MTNIRTLMTDDHRHCDDLLAETENALAKRNSDLAKVTFENFRCAILAHFEAEEKTLFPTFEAKTGMHMGPTQVMRLEHAQMRTLLDEAGDALNAGQLDDYFGVAETLLIMMQQHNMKEENVLYPMCDQHLVPELSTVLERLELDLSVT